MLAAGFLPSSAVLGVSRLAEAATSTNSAIPIYIAIITGIFSVAASYLAGNRKRSKADRMQEQLTELELAEKIAAKKAALGKRSLRARKPPEDMP